MGVVYTDFTVNTKQNRPLGRLCDKLHSKPAYRLRRDYFFRLRVVFLAAFRAGLRVVFFFAVFLTTFFLAAFFFAGFRFLVVFFTAFLATFRFAGFLLAVLRTAFLATFRVDRFLATRFFAAGIC